MLPASRGRFDPGSPLDHESPCDAVAVLDAGGVGDQQSGRNRPDA